MVTQHTLNFRHLHNAKRTLLGKVGKGLTIQKIYFAIRNDDGVDLVFGMGTDLERGYDLEFFYAEVEEAEPIGRPKKEILIFDRKEGTLEEFVDLELSNEARDYFYSPRGIHERISRAEYEQIHKSFF